jgi:hypothetical protein
MKRCSLVFLAWVLAITASAQDGKTNAQPELKKAAAVASETAPQEVQTPGLDFPESAGVISAPFVLTNGYLYQPSNQTEVAEGGRAVYIFTITNAGNYVIHTVVKALAGESNSFFLNIDGTPEDPTMIWDIELTTDFAERVVSWRGSGSDSSDEFVPKRFNLAAGKHKLFIYGREPDVQLKSISIRPAPAN